MISDVRYSRKSNRLAIPIIFLNKGVELCLKKAGFICNIK